MSGKQNRKQPVDFVAEAERIMNAPFKDEQKKPEQARRKNKSSIDTVIQTILMICCVTLAGLVVYTLQF